MNHLICAVYDSKAKVYCAPFTVAALGIALRAFHGEANNPQSQLGRYPADFTLFELGVFNDESGTFRIYEQQLNHGLAASFKEPSHVRLDASQPVRNEALVLAGATGGNTPVDV